MSFGVSIFGWMVVLSTIAAVAFVVMMVIWLVGRKAL